MDYKEKYEEALERARQIHNEGKAQGFDVMTKVFPELGDNENDRIRQDIITTLSIGVSCKESALHPGAHTTLKEAIDWLEKQGDKDKLIQDLGKYKVKYTQEVLEKHVNSMSIKDDERLRKTTIAFLKDFAEQGYENAVECIDWLEKQGEQKPVDTTQDLSACKAQPKEGLLEEGRSGADPIYLNDAVDYKTESLLALIPGTADWSEEDEKDLLRIMKILKEQAYADYDVDEDGELCGVYKHLSNWLQSLRSQRLKEN